MNYTKHFECGCKVVVIGELTNTEIHYCPKHKAAPELYNWLDFLASRVSIMGGLKPVIQEGIRYALDEAEGKGS